MESGDGVSKMDDGSPPPPGMSRRHFAALLALSGAGIPLRRLQGAEAAPAGERKAVKSASFVMVGDFGAGHVLDNMPIGEQNPNSRAVAAGVHRLAPLSGDAYVVSLGDQIYVPYDDNIPSPQYPYLARNWLALNTPRGNTPYDQAVGELYAGYIKFPEGSLSAYAAKGSKTQRFLAILGDHDWFHEPRKEVHDRLYFPLDTASYPARTVPGQPVYEFHGVSGESSAFLQYFGNQGEGSSSGSNRYWDLPRGNIHWYALSSDANEVLLGTLVNAYYSDTPLPGGLTPGRQNLLHSVQGAWFRETVAKPVPAAWKFLITHYPPYSSSNAALNGHPSAAYMQWDYHTFGVDVVFSGHVHAYERLYKDGIPYVVSGAGGTFQAAAGYPDKLLPISRKTVAGEFGFLAAEEKSGSVSFKYYATTPQTGLPYREPDFRIADHFTLVKGGTLSSRAEIGEPDSIVITRGGGVFDLVDFDVSLNAKLQGTGVLSKLGGGTLRFTGPNHDFTGTLALHQGAIEILSHQALQECVAIAGHGGTVIVDAVRQTFSTPFELKGPVTIDIRRAAELRFADSSGADWHRGAVLTLAGDPRGIRFGATNRGLSQAQLSQIRFAAGSMTASLDSEGYLTGTPENALG